MIVSNSMERDIFSAKFSGMLHNLSETFVTLGNPFYIPYKDNEH